VSLPPRQHELYRALRLRAGLSATRLAARLADEVTGYLDGLALEPVKQQVISSYEAGPQTADKKHGRAIPEDPPIALDKTRADVREPDDFDWHEAAEPPRACRFLFDWAFRDDLDAGAEDDPYVYAVVRLVEPDPARGGSLPFEHYDPPVAYDDSLAGRDAADKEAARRGDDAVVVLLTAPGLRPT
jgi:hypothetical protein